ncbi:hypothetical protein HDU67_009361, partial [Dinochytrium kinnereticum]
RKRGREEDEDEERRTRKRPVQPVTPPSTTQSPVEVALSSFFYSAPQNDQKSSLFVPRSPTTSGKAHFSMGKLDEILSRGL